jgi:hypothetical protein
MAAGVRRMFGNHALIRLRALFKTLKYHPTFRPASPTLTPPATSATGSSQTQTWSTATPGSACAPHDVHYGLAADVRLRRPAKMSRSPRDLPR